MSNASKDLPSDSKDSPDGKDLPSDGEDWSS
jgi:hypothetical protein